MIVCIGDRQAISTNTKNKRKEMKQWQCAYRIVILLIIGPRNPVDVQKTKRIKLTET